MTSAWTSAPRAGFRAMDESSGEVDRVAFGKRRAQGRSGNPSPQATCLGGCSGGRALLECHDSDQAHRPGHLFTGPDARSRRGRPPPLRRQPSTLDGPRSARFRCLLLGKHGCPLEQAATIAPLTEAAVGDELPLRIAEVMDRSAVQQRRDPCSPWRPSPGAPAGGSFPRTACTRTGNGTRGGSRCGNVRRSSPSALSASSPGSHEAVARLCLVT